MKQTNTQTKNVATSSRFGDKIGLITKMMIANGDLDLSLMERKVNLLEKDVIINMKDLANALENVDKLSTKGRFYIDDNILTKKLFLVGALINFFDETEFDTLIDIVNHLARQEHLKLVNQIIGGL